MYVFIIFEDIKVSFCRNFFSNKPCLKDSRILQILEPSKAIIAHVMNQPIIIIAARSDTPFCAVVYLYENKDLVQYVFTKRALI